MSCVPLMSKCHVQEESFLKKYQNHVELYKFNFFVHKTEIFSDHDVRILSKETHFEFSL